MERKNSGKVISIGFWVGRSKKEGWDRCLFASKFIPGKELAYSKKLVFFFYWSTFILCVNKPGIKPMQST